MSEMNDSSIYNFYDYVKSIYIYSHVKTHLIDAQRQKIEIFTNSFLLILSISFLFLSIFKIIVIIFYFIFIQAFSAFIKFIISICKTKFRLNFLSSFKNAIYYLGKVCKRIYTFNFKIFHNYLIGSVMVFSYFFFLFSSAFFYYQNIILIEKIEKPKEYMASFYCHFESFILIQLLFSSFYTCRDMNLSTLISIGLFLNMNAILFLGYFITDTLENEKGSFEFSEPQNLMNIIFNSIFLFINGSSLLSIIFYDGNRK